MKKTITILSVLFLSATVCAQNTFKPETYFGFKIGGNISRIITTPIVKQKANFGLTSGIVFKHISQKNLGIQIELNYKQAGWIENLDSSNAYQRSLDYLELPFMTNFNLGNQETRFVINVGPYVSYLLSEKEKLNLLENEVERDYYRKKLNNKYGFGLCLGLGISRYNSIGLFHVESRISYSLTDILPNTGESYLSASKNLNIELSLSYMIGSKSLKRPDKNVI